MKAGDLREVSRGEVQLSAPGVGCSLPAALWQELKSNGLIADTAPVPEVAP